MYAVMTKRRRSEHYVNNKEFLIAIVEYKAMVRRAAENGEPKPRITNYLGECFLKIATHLYNYFPRSQASDKKLQNLILQDMAALKDK